MLAGGRVFGRADRNHHMLSTESIIPEIKMHPPWLAKFPLKFYNIFSEELQ